MKKNVKFLLTTSVERIGYDRGLNEGKAPGKAEGKAEGERSLIFRKICVNG